MPMSLLYPLDREAFQVLYSRLDNGDGPTDYGNWSKTSLHIAGNGTAANFGVALRNGLAQPWAHGYLPASDLADNRALSGSATWVGTLLGLTPDAAAVVGDAEINVRLATLTGRADFDNLESWAPNAAPGEAGTGATWLSNDDDPRDDPERGHNLGHVDQAIRHRSRTPPSDRAPCSVGRRPE